MAMQFAYYLDIGQPWFTRKEAPMVTKAHYRDNDNVLITVPGRLMNLVREEARALGLTLGNRENQTVMIRLILEQRYSRSEKEIGVKLGK